MEDKSRIVRAAGLINALKSGGYKSTYNAIAEIVDNSFDADASDVLIVGEQSKTADTQEKNIISFAFFDNGNGMNEQKLNDCLSIGYSTGDDRRGMGRFGVGLPQASFFVSDHVEVYSWQKGIENARRVYLDINEIKENDSDYIEPSVMHEIPDKYKKYITWDTGDKKFDFTKKGTLVIWEKCTNVDHKKWTTCVNHMSQDIGRKYRYWISRYNKTIGLIEYQSNNYTKVLANDPLFLINPSQDSMPSSIDDLKKYHYMSGNKLYMSGNKLPNNFQTESLFEVYKIKEENPDEHVVNISYRVGNEMKTGDVIIKYSIVKKKYYSEKSLGTTAKPGSLEFGKTLTLKRNLGVSVVRKEREIDFGRWEFFDGGYLPEYRWWGVEIAFDSSMDEAFHISNNKQYVDLKPLSEDDRKEEVADNSRSLWHQLYNEIHSTINDMTARNRSIRDEKIEDEKEDSTDVVSDIINTVEEENGEPKEIIDITDEEIREQIIDELKDKGIENINDTQIKKFIDKNVDFRIDRSKTKTDNFISSKKSAGVVVIIINGQHPFFTVFVQDILDDKDKELPFKLLLAAVEKSIKRVEDAYGDAMDLYTLELNNLITKYMLEYNKRNA